MAAYEIVERDEAGTITKTYIASGEGRVDVIVRKKPTVVVDSRPLVHYRREAVLVVTWPQNETWVQRTEELC
jgi:hypothetical protein